MKKLALVTSVIVTGLVASTIAPAAAVEEGVKSDPGTIAWSPCPDTDPNLGAMLKGLECGSVQVPLDYSQPDGRKITLALTRAKHTVSDAEYRGVVVLNRGQWPGGIGRDLPTRYAQGTTGLAQDVGAAYDWIGFDPRGVGASEPALVCDTSYTNPGQAQPDPVPPTPAAEQQWVDRARAYAESCGAKYGDVLEHLSTKDAARDLDQMRIALGQDKITYFGTDWGTYLGSVYASMYPNRVRRMVLDSVVRPSGVGYRNHLDKNVTSERNAEIFFAWVAKYDSTYHLGTTAAEVEANYYKGQDALRAAPVDGKIGPAEWTDVFEPVVYRSWTWLSRAKVLSDWVVRGDATSLRSTYSPWGYPHQNRTAMTNAVNCLDGPWPRDWNTWHTDYSGQYAAGNRMLTWTNAWYQAPCAFWPVPAQAPAQVGNSTVDTLLVQPEFDTAHGTAGAYETHSLFPNSRLILEQGGHNVGAALSANNNTCLNAYVSNYLRDGTRPASRAGADAVCQASADPVPAS
ncbi:alpha/beta fold hydrolase [Streptomyces jeddahensis]|uniref:Tripeptidyl aminopeptidase n=1 Tax=Streptomyces jeddahensis TaxID=1716141 RepID=A0A177HIY3_9ACTN|nr:alpha/beta fold hydrolase [Streptomyces jeddahensis]OAH10932.1 tripeptidyl aminopeptidase precursor [Streptomyces jeddahensis]